MDVLDSFDVFEGCPTFFADDGLNLFGECSSGLEFPQFSSSNLDGFASLPSSSTVGGENNLGSCDLFDLLSWDDIQSASDDLGRGPCRELNQDADTTESVHKVQDSSKSSSPQKLHREEESPGLREDGSGMADSRKRKWDSSVLVFPVSNDVKAVQQRRKAFGPTRRHEVARNRSIGACIQCKLRKGSCNFGIPCSHCIKRAGSVLLGQEICTRRSLVAARFDCIDLFQLASVETRMENLGLPSINGGERHILLGYPPFQGPSAACIKVRIVDFEHPGVPPVQNLLIIDYYNLQRMTIKNSCYAISWDSLPSVDDLICVYNASRSNYCPNAGPFKGLHQTFRDFARRYCSMAHEMPLHGLLQKATRMQLLFDIYRTGAFVNDAVEEGRGVDGAFKTAGIYEKGEDTSFERLRNAIPFEATTDHREGKRRSSTNPWNIVDLDSGDRYPSSVVSLQLRFILSKAILEIELEILSEIDKLVNGGSAIGRKHPIATWACLWVLILSYKEHMVFIRRYYLSSKVEQQLYSLATHIYNTLTAIYSALFKTSSPLTLDWRTEEVSEMLGNDPELIRLFCSIKTEMFWFQTAINMLCAEDTLFKTLIVENDNKLLASHKKTAKKQGLL